MLADIQRTVYPEEVTRQLHVMAQARESLLVTGQCSTGPLCYAANYFIIQIPNSHIRFMLISYTISYTTIKHTCLFRDNKVHERSNSRCIFPLVTFTARLPLFQRLHVLMNWFPFSSGSRCAVGQRCLNCWDRRWPTEVWWACFILNGGAGRTLQWYRVMLINRFLQHVYIQQQHFGLGSVMKICSQHLKHYLH